MMWCYFVCAEEWKGDPEFAQYMTDLTSYSIEKLRKESSLMGVVFL